MRTCTIIILSAFFFQAKAQVKEVNFLGKNWYLHGYDFRIKGRFYTPKFYKSLLKNAEYPDENYATRYVDSTKTVMYDYLTAVNTVSGGFIFRPFNQVKSKIIKQVEFIHNVEIEHISMRIETKQVRASTPSLIKSTQIGYNPRLTISSPPVVKSLKFYFALDGYAYLPLSSLIYNQIPSSLTTDRVSYNKGNRTYNNRIQSNHFKYGAGGSFGVKMNLSRKWNFHMEYSIYNIYTKHSTTPRITAAGNTGVQFGLRYKFGTPNIDDKGFW